eukprot:TRINITY_DN8738_c0_g1_i4.p1 TRINITY_DN8738_c0_g1~~TRINITY_DN8738_c0_g1_i4.p1  ORF type:complete len:157 (+),score=34.74 TRINITY_DN8738_c0_g1_i4:81-551(+)
MASSSPSVIDIVGNCILCIHPNGEFQGRLVDSATKILYGLHGGMAESDHIHDCCRGPDGVQPYRLTITDYKTKKSMTVIVEKTGGDYYAFRSHHHNEDETLPNVQFDTTTLLVDHDAEEKTSSLFPALIGQDCIICVGEMHMNRIAFHDSQNESKE